MYFVSAMISNVFFCRQFINVKWGHLWFAYMHIWCHTRWCRPLYHSMNPYLVQFSFSLQAWSMCWLPSHFTLQRHVLHYIFHTCTDHRVNREILPQPATLVVCMWGNYSVIFTNYHVLCFLLNQLRTCSVLMSSGTFDFIVPRRMDPYCKKSIL